MIEFTHKNLCKIAEKWLGKRKKQNILYPTFPLHVSEMVCVEVSETPDAIGWNYWSSCVVEVKVSKSDFWADQKKTFRKDGSGMGTFRYYLCPENLIAENELPEGWGLIYVSSNGKTKEIKNSERFPLSKESYCNEKNYLFSICNRLKNG